MKKFMLALTLLLNGVILLNSCKEDEIIDPVVDYDTQTSQDNSLAESTFNDLNNIVNQAIARGDSGLTTYRLGDDQYSLLSSCATVNVNPNVPPTPGGTITVNFGTINCPCSDGRWRRGIINITYTGAYRDSGTVINTTFTDYFVGKDTSNMFEVTGTKTVTNKGRNSSGFFNFDISVDGHMINNASVTMDWTSTRNREWITGYSSQYVWNDDEYKITGNAQGTNFEGNSYTAVITSPLVVSLNCRWIKEGKFELTPTGKPVRYFDYGNGDCDANASVTINGKRIDFLLR